MTGLPNLVVAHGVDLNRFGSDGTSYRDLVTSVGSAYAGSSPYFIGSLLEGVARHENV